MAFELPNAYTEYVPLDILLAEQLNNDIANNQYMADNFPRDVIVSETMTTAEANSFFSGSYTKAFTIPVDGTYELCTPFSVTVHNTTPTVFLLAVRIDNVRLMQYQYTATSQDSEWGGTRRTITGTSVITNLTTGTHTLDTVGNLYYQAPNGQPGTLPQIYLRRLVV